MTPRDFGPPTRSPRQHFEQLVAEAKAGASADATPDTMGLPRMAFLFGSERFGMKNEDVYRCHVALSIPTNPQFGSLNLASAVQLIAYEWRQALGGFDVTSPSSIATRADARAVTGMLEHWQEVLVQIGFLNPEIPRKLMPRLNQVAIRAQLTEEEIHILRGVARAVGRWGGMHSRLTAAGDG